MVVEAQLAPQFIDRVRPGLPADVGFDAYVSIMRRPRVAGVVETVSAARPVSAEAAEAEAIGAPNVRAVRATRPTTSRRTRHLEEVPVMAEA